MNVVELLYGISFIDVICFRIFDIRKVWFMKRLVKCLTSVALIGAMMLSATGCVSFGVIEYGDFVDALEEEANLKESACTKGKNRRHEGYEMKRYI